MLKRFMLLVVIWGYAAFFSDSGEMKVLAASESETITRQLQKVKQEIEEAQQLEKKASSELKSIQAQKEEYNGQVILIEQEIAETNTKLASLQEQIYEVEQNLTLTNKQLVETEERVEERKQLLQSRLRLLYMNGFVSYLEVLLNSTSFIDFLDRLSAIQSIIKQDQTLLASLANDKNTMEMQKKDIEAQLEYVDGLLAEANAIKAQLQVKRDNRVVAIASLETKEDELELLSEDQERELFRLVDEQSKLIKQQAALKVKSNGTNNKIKKYTGGQMQWPLPSSDRITSYVGGRINPVTQKPQNHSGLDIAAPGGSDIIAAASGTVVLAQWYGNFGNCVIIEHGDGIRTLYAHIRSGGIKVKTGDEVSAGDKIAEVGSTGRSTGNHLHFGVYVDNTVVDPLPYVGDE